MKKTLIKTYVLLLFICIATILIKSCKKKDEHLLESDKIAQFTYHLSRDNNALEMVIKNIKLQLAQKDFSANFIKWHGQPLWDKAVTVQKDAVNYILLIPTQKNNNIETFIAARLKDSKFEYELHRRTAMEKNLTEPSVMKITGAIRQHILAYFNNSILGKTDQFTVLPNNNLEQ
jgi:hypothetical protein